MDVDMQGMISPGEFRLISGQGKNFAIY